MSTVVRPTHDPRVRTIDVTDDLITAHRTDGRTISVPLAWSWRLAEATPEQRRHSEVLGESESVHRSDVDEDISVRGMLAACRPRVRAVTEPERHSDA